MTPTYFLKNYYDFSGENKIQSHLVELFKLVIFQEKEFNSW